MPNSIHSPSDQLLQARPLINRGAGMRLEAAVSPMLPAIGCC